MERMGEYEGGNGELFKQIMLRSTSLALEPACIGDFEIALHRTRRGMFIGDISGSRLECYFDMSGKITAQDVETMQGWAPEAAAARVVEAMQQIACEEGAYSDSVRESWLPKAA